MIENQTLTESMLELLSAMVKGRLNILVSGGTGAGKTTLLNVLSGYIPNSERIVTIEDAAELQLKQEHIVRLETRPPNIEGKGAVRQRQLVINSLRMRPDRIVVGEVRGEEAFDMLQAMNTGHEGSLTTVHANSPRDALARVENMVSMANLNIPERAVRQQIASAVHAVVQIARLSDGTRKVITISEITGMDNESIAMQDIFSFDRSGIDESGKVRGLFHATGVRPSLPTGWRSRGPVCVRRCLNPGPRCDNHMPPILIALLVFVVVAVAVFAVLSLLDQRNARARLIKERLASERKGAERSPEEELALVRDEQLSNIPALDTLLRRSERVSDIQKMLAQAGMTVRAGNFLGLCVAVGVAAAITAYVREQAGRGRLDRFAGRRAPALLLRVVQAHQALRKVRRTFPRSHRHPGPRRPRRPRLHHRAGNDHQRGLRARLQRVPPALRGTEVRHAGARRSDESDRAHALWWT